MSPSESHRPADAELFAALHHLSGLARGRRVVRLRAWYDDGSDATFRLPPCPRSCPAPPDRSNRDPPGEPDADDWPPPRGWAFRPGQVARDGLAFPLRGLKHRLLELLARRPGTPVPMAAIRHHVWGDYDASESTVRGLISQTRAWLRAAFELPADADPLPCADGACVLADF